MYNMFHILLIWIATIFISIVVTPIIKRIAFKIGAVDKPDKRRVNKVMMPTMGGTAIYVSSFLSLFLLQPVDNNYLWPIFIASTLIITTGIIDDIYEINPLIKIIGILIAGLIVFFIADISMDTIVLPLFGKIELGWLSLPITLIWILGVTNSINLIDGLDGLATGVSIIALSTMGILGYFFIITNKIPLIIFIFTIVSATIGFLPYNFYPASIFLGDTGALFLGFIVSIVSLQGLKNATILSFIIPIVILGVPITDTFYAIVRRKLNKKPVTVADKNHLHHRLMYMGMGHRQTVLFIYLFAAIFSVISLLFPISSSISILLLIISILIGVELFVESIGLLGEDFSPMLTFINKMFSKIKKK